MVSSDLDSRVVRGAERGRVVFWGINSSKGFSGGRYHAWLMSEAAAERGWTVSWVTNDRPLFLDDLDDATIFPAHKEIRIELCRFENLPANLGCDILVVVPHGSFELEFYGNALAFAARTAARVVLLNFETANWFNSLSLKERDPARWRGWKMVADHAAMILSSAAESTGFAREFYRPVAKETRFEHCWAPINSRVADRLPDIPKEKRVLIFTRFAHAEHKGASLIPEVVSEAMRGHTLVFVVGVGTPPIEFTEAIAKCAERFGARVEFLSRLSDEEKWCELKRAALVLFPSFFEGFGLPPVEAQYAGTPCIAFELPVLREVSGDGVFYVPLGDIRAMRDKAAEVLQRGGSYAHLHDRIAPTFCFDAYSHRVDDLLSDVFQVGPRCYAYEPAKAPVVGAAAAPPPTTAARPAPVASEPTTAKEATNPLVLPERPWPLRVSGKRGSDEQAKPRVVRAAAAPLLRPAALPAAPMPTIATAATNPQALPEKAWPAWTSYKRDTSPRMRQRIAAAESARPWSDNDGKIASIKGIHEGRTGWLCGNGPSVRIEDLERLQNEVTFGCNRIYLAYDKMRFRPTYLCSTDEQMIRDFGPEMVERHPGMVLLVANENPKLRGEYVWFQMGSRTPLEFSTNVYDFVMPGGGTLIAAVQIGFHMGITRFYTYGMDHNFTFAIDEKEKDHYKKASGDGNHFISGYRSGKRWAPPVLWQVEGALLSCHVFLQQYGGWIRNATRGGKLEVLSRVDFDLVSPLPGGT